MAKRTAPKKFKIERGALDHLDDEIFMEDLALPINEAARPPKGKVWDIFSTNPHLTRAQVSLAAIGEALVEVLNGGLFHLIMNPPGALIPDMPAAFREVGLEDEAKILDRVRAMFPDDAVLRDHEKRVAFASTKIVPGGWDGVGAKTKTELYQDLKALETPLAGHLQSQPFFRALADFVAKHPESFEIIDD